VAQITLFDDERRPDGGFALMRVSGLAQADPALTGVTIRRLVGRDRCLGPTGWQAAEHVFVPRGVGVEGQDLIILIGPEIVDQVEADTGIEIALPRLQVAQQIRWPSLTASLSRMDLPEQHEPPPSMRIDSLLGEEPPADPSPPPEPAPQLRVDRAPEPEPDPMVAGERPQASDQPRFPWILLILLLLFSAVGIAAFLLQDQWLPLVMGPDEQPTPTVAAVATPTPSPQPTPSPAPTPTPTPAPTPTAAPTPSPTPQPTPSLEALPSAEPPQPTPQPSTEPSPDATPADITPSERHQRAVQALAGGEPDRGVPLLRLNIESFNYGPSMLALAEYYAGNRNPELGESLRLIRRACDSDVFGAAEALEDLQADLEARAVGGDALAQTFLGPPLEAAQAACAP